MLKENESLSPQQPLTAQAATPTPSTGLRLTRQAGLRRARHSARTTDPGSADDTNTAVSDPLETAAAQGECLGTAPNFTGPGGWAGRGAAARATGGLAAARVLPPRHSDHGFRAAGNCTGSR